MLLRWNSRAVGLHQEEGSWLVCAPTLEGQRAAVHRERPGVTLAAPNNIPARAHRRVAALQIHVQAAQAGQRVQRGAHL